MPCSKYTPIEDASLLQYACLVDFPFYPFLKLRASEVVASVSFASGYEIAQEGVPTCLPSSCIVKGSTCSRSSSHFCIAPAISRCEVTFPKHLSFHVRNVISHHHRVSRDALPDLSFQLLSVKSLHYRFASSIKTRLHVHIHELSHTDVCAARGTRLIPHPASSGLKKVSSPPHLGPHAVRLLPLQPISSSVDIILDSDSDFRPLAYPFDNNHEGK
ncbi:unnamed protein product [Periconia digitata]|uniref:Uncharacterized protein n=1 Tax=Periconia digitata TaxID=1303443 RepID=A0A9W4XQ44_9PLEO|nr:unnamed protein product [Periconia digitata]